MAKESRFKEWQESAPQQEVQAEEMTLEEARAYRASLHKPAIKSFSEQEKREEFRLFWAQEKYKFGKSKDLEEILWLHLKATKMDEPSKFQDGLTHFGLKKV